jgi:sugar lactone lactonase YvrE
MLVKSIVSSGDELGESVFWSALTSAVYWIDGVAPLIHRYSPSDGSHETSALLLPPPVGMIACTTDPNVLVASCSNGVALVRLDTGKAVNVADPERQRSSITYNDGKVDTQGRLWIGTYDPADHEHRGCLWVLESAQTSQLVETGFTVTNGPAFAPDGRVVYVSDSIARRIVALDVSGTTLSGRRVFAVLTDEEGYPDGLAIDGEGCLWCAHWGGSRVTRFAPSGKRLMTISLPAPQVTSVAFGGPDFETLFITTARLGLDNKELALFPQSGNLFAVCPGVRGIPATPLPLPFIEYSTEGPHA